MSQEYLNSWVLLQRISLYPGTSQLSVQGIDGIFSSLSPDWVGFCPFQLKETVKYRTYVINSWLWLIVIGGKRLWHAFELGKQLVLDF